MALTTRRTAGGAILRGRPGAVGTRAYIRGGPDLIKALARLEKGLRDEALAGATQAGADVLAEAWRERVRSTIGIGPGVAHYAEAIQAKAKAGKRGATGLVDLATVATNEGEAQPREYAPRFEFGSTQRSLAQFKAGVSIAGRARVAKPTLRPAFDASRDRMIDAIATKLRDLIAKAT